MYPYSMSLKRVLHTDNGKMLIAVILGIGLATLFRKSCSNKECLEFKGPKLDDIKDKVFKYENECYTFKPNPAKCSSEKRTVHFA
jgi:hypothetical protein